MYQLYYIHSRGYSYPWALTDNYKDAVLLYNFYHNLTSYGPGLSIIQATGGLPSYEEYGNFPAPVEDIMGHRNWNTSKSTEFDYGEPGNFTPVPKGMGVYVLSVKMGKWLDNPELFPYPGFSEDSPEDLIVVGFSEEDAVRRGGVVEDWEEFYDIRMAEEESRVVDLGTRRRPCVKDFVGKVWIEFLG